MIPVKTLPRFKCDFCKKRSTKTVMEKHERRCFRNPDRYCEECQNLGFISVEIDEMGTHQQPCEYCSRFDPEKLKAIEEYEKKYVEEGVQDADFQDTKNLMG